MLDSSATPDAQPAASSPAPAVSPSSVSLDSLNETELQAWRMDGKLPTERQAATPPADSSPATPEIAQAASTDAPRPAASEPATPAKGAEARIPELLKHRKDALERAERAERRAAELEARLQPKPDVTPAVSSPAPAGLVKPDPESFTYGTSDPAYLEALTDYRWSVNNERERATWQEGERKARALAEQTRVITEFETRAVAARAKHPDFDAVALLAPTEIPQGSAADLWVLEDEAGAEILYHLQQPNNAAERRRILSLGPRQQLKELVLLGHRLTSDAPAAPSTASLPVPVPALTTRATPADAVERSLAEGTSDEATGRYIEAQNRRDLARLKR